MLGSIFWGSVGAFPPAWGKIGFRMDLPMTVVEQESLEPAFRGNKLLGKTVLVDSRPGSPHVRVRLSQ